MGYRYTLAIVVVFLLSSKVRSVETQPASLCPDSATRWRQVNRVIRKSSPVADQQLGAWVSALDVDTEANVNMLCGWLDLQQKEIRDLHAEVDTLKQQIAKEERR